MMDDNMDRYILKIEGFGLINEAEIELANINVVGGVNASGKSTASKLLYCFLKAMSANRKNYLLTAILPEINKFINIMEQPKRGHWKDLPNKFSFGDDFFEILNNYIVAKKIFKSLLDSNFFHDPYDEVYSDMENRIDDHINILLSGDGKEFDSYNDGVKYDDDYSFDKSEVYSNFVKSLMSNESLLSFNGKSSFYNTSFRSFFVYEDDNFDYSTEGEYDSLNEVYYIDSVSTFDLDYYVESKRNINDVFGYKEHVEYLLKQLRKDKDESRLSSETSDKVNVVLDRITEIIGGYTSRTGTVKFKDKYFNESYYFHPVNSDKKFNINISSGIQQIGIIQILLANYSLQPGSFLIIDEPEVNLHPDWQFKFAEILVLLAKELNITVYLNSHSPTFIESIDAFTEFYDMEQDINYYLTEETEDAGKYDFTKISSDELYKIYDNLGNAYDLIDQLRLKKHLGE